MDTAQTHTNTAEALRQAEAKRRALEVELSELLGKRVQVDIKIFSNVNNNNNSALALVAAKELGWKIIHRYNSFGWVDTNNGPTTGDFTIFVGTLNDRP